MWPQSLVSIFGFAQGILIVSLVSVRSRDFVINPLNDLVDIQFERNDIDFNEDFVFVGCGRDFPSLEMNMPSSRILETKLDRIREVEALTVSGIGRGIIWRFSLCINDDHMEAAAAAIQAELGRAVSCS